MRILVVEYSAGGGYAGSSIPASVLSEGFAMLKALTSDIYLAGHKASTILDSRIATLAPPLDAQCREQVSSQTEFEKAFEVAAEDVEAAYIIAPESGGILAALVEEIEHLGITPLNCTSSSISYVSNKSVLMERAKQLGFSTPKTLSFCVNDSLEDVTASIRSDLGFPAILKPIDGVSCSSLSVVNEEEEVKNAIDKLRTASLNTAFLAQEIVRGETVSVSLYSNGVDALPVSMNRQFVTLNTPELDSAFNGGVVPYETPSKRKAFSMAEKIVESIKGLKGYVGVDLVLAEESPVIIEVNPRLTTSYVGLRRVSPFNPSEALLESTLNRKLPLKSELFGYSCFAKVETTKPKRNQLLRTYRLPSVMSPPFPVSRDYSAFAMVTSHDKALQRALSRLEKNKCRLLRTLGGEDGD